MPPDPTIDEVELTERLANEPTNRDLVILVGAMRREQRLTRAIVVALSVVVIILSVITYKVSENAKQLARVDQVTDVVGASLRRTCAEGNTAKSGEAELWNYLLNLPTTPNQTPEQQATRAGLVEIIGRIFDPIDCTKTGTNLP